jgi:two-component sensor histidine kinase/PAS domain-containing protein
MELEKDLTINDNLQSLIFNNAFDAIIYYTPVIDESGNIKDFNFAFMNDSAFKFLRGTREDYIGKTFLNLFPYGAVNGMFANFSKTFQTGTPTEQTYYYEHNIYKGWYRDSVIKAGDGIIVFFRDVTESKEMEINLNKKTEELQDSLNLISNIISSIKDPFLVINDKFQIVYANAAMEYWFEGTAPFTGKVLWDILPVKKSARMEKILRENMQMQTYKSFNIKGFVNDRHYNISLYPYYGGLTIYAKDTTDKILADEQLKRSLKEKEILLKEIHHRVKNNLQLIASMMNLQCSFVKDPVYNDLLRDSKNRISTMAIIHQRLYEESNYATIKFKSFAEELIRSLFDIYSFEGKHVTLSCRIEDVDVGLDASINIGLILNELMTNSLKYAFRGRQKGEVKVDISRNGSQVIIKVEDNGVGFPEHIDFRNTESLGLLIVNSLVDQLDGQLELDRTEGTRFIITLYREKKKQLDLI